MTVRLEVLAAGYCEQARHFVFPGETGQMHFPALFALIEHPTKGVLLFDTGYGLRYFEATRYLPYRLYAMLAPVMLKPDETAAAQLAVRGISPRDVSTVITSHFHADHVGGLRDFPDARFTCSQAAFERVRGKRGIRAVRRGLLPQLIPDDFERRARLLEDEAFVRLSPTYTPFAHGADLLGDGSLVAVQLEGHASGQLGLLAQTGNGTIFLCADAVWHSRALRKGVLPHQATRLFISKWSDYIETFNKIRHLHQLRPDIEVIPSHCAEAYERHVSSTSAPRKTTDTPVGV